MPAPGESPTGPTASRTRCRLRGSVRARRRSSSAGSSRPRSPGSILEINPFDQPDVQAAKDRTSEVLAQAATSSSSRRGRPTSSSRRRGEGDYVCIQAFVDPTAENEQRLARARRARPRGHRAASSRTASGPRYLHSTGQLHKGGPNTGLFLQVVDDTGEELPIPGQPFGFGRLIRAQAAGDYESLQGARPRASRASRLEEV